MEDLTGGNAKATPHFAQNTVVQPKEDDEQYGEAGEAAGILALPRSRNAEQDQINTAFSVAGSVGIRSLPNALEPNFRQRLTEEVLAKTKKYNMTEAGTGTGARPAVSKAEPLSTSTSKGQRKPGQYSSVRPVFSVYEYQPSEYSLQQEVELAEKHAGRAKWVQQESFVVRALPAIPKHTGAFNEFEYEFDPYERQDEKAREDIKKKNAKIKYGPLKSGGRIQREEHMKVRAEEMIRAMTVVLSKDWKVSFLRVFEDPQGLIVVCFDRQKMTEGDITSYMNQFFRTNSTVTEFKLKRDTTRWGVMEDTVPNVYYVFIPPWVHARIVHPELSQVPDNKPVPGLAEPPLASSRMPFQPTTESGVPIPIPVQTYARSFQL